jgi:hypothetical protein
VKVEQMMYDYLNDNHYSYLRKYFERISPGGGLFSMVTFSGTSTKSSGFVDINVVGFDERLTDDLVVFIVGAGLFTEFGDGERRLVVDCEGAGNVFGITSGSYSGIGSI